MRSTGDNQALWAGIQTGGVHTLGTDHCPFHLEQKSPDTPFEDIPNGLGGVETALPLMFTHFIRQGWDLQRLVKLTSANAAGIFGLSSRKGSLQAGADADIVIFNPETPAREWSAELVSELGWNAYTDLPAQFPHHVFRRGEHMVRDGRLIGKSLGNFLAMDLPISHK